jgi:hypothetical protein
MSASDSAWCFVTETPYRTRARTPRKSPLSADNSARYCNFASGSLVEQKHAARQHRGADRLSHAAPASKTLLIRAAERGNNLGAITGAMLRLLDRYSAVELQAAIIEALDRNVPHPSAVRLALERRRHDRQQLPPVAVNLPEHVQARDVPVRPPRLELYDQLKRPSDE